MPQKPRVTTLMDSHHVNRSKTLLKSSQQYFCDIFDHFDKKSGPKIMLY